MPTKYKRKDEISPYTAERVCMALFKTARHWEEEKMSGLAGRSLTAKEKEKIITEAESLRAVGRLVVEGDWGYAKTTLSKLATPVLEAIPDFPWNTIHLA